MCIRAALAIQDGSTVIFNTPYKDTERDIRNQVMDYLSLLGITTGRLMINPPPDWVRGLSKIYTLEERVWQDRMVRRFRGPFDMIREIRGVDSRLLAYAEDDELLFELTCEGVESLKRDIGIVLDPAANTQMQNCIEERLSQMAPLLKESLDTASNDAPSTPQPALNPRDYGPY
jgi:hypothetical protein